MKALVVYGSKRGGTAGLAQLIGAELAKYGWEVEVRDAAVRVPIGQPDLVVVGGALYMNHWHSDARAFVRQHMAFLQTVPVWMFSSGPLDDSARSGDLAPVPQVLALAQRVEARGHMTFGGRLTPDAKGFMAHSMAKKCAGDYRDPVHVAEWVRQIMHELAPVEESVSVVDVRAGIPAQRRAARRAPAAT